MTYKAWSIEDIETFTTEMEWISDTLKESLITFKRSNLKRLYVPNSVEVEVTAARIRRLASSILEAAKDQSQCAKTGRKPLWSENFSRNALKHGNKIDESGDIVAMTPQEYAAEFERRKGVPYKAPKGKK